MMDYNVSLYIPQPRFPMHQPRGGESLRARIVPVERRLSIPEATEEGFFTDLVLMAAEFQELKEGIREEAERFQRLSRAESVSPVQAARLKAEGERSISVLRQAVQDLPRAVMQYVTQNPVLYRQIQQAGGFRAWSGRFGGGFRADEPLPGLLRVLEEGLRQLRDTPNE